MILFCFKQYLHKMVKVPLNLILFMDLREFNKQVSLKNMAQKNLVMLI